MNSVVMRIFWKRTMGALLWGSFMTLACPVQAASIEGVNRTNVIRCGYVEYAPALTQDIKTGLWQGFNYDILKAVGDRLQLQVNYTAPTGWATVVPDLKSRKFDMLCSGFWVHPNVGKFALFSRPAFFQPVFVAVRTQENRFQRKVDLNDAKLKMVALDGDNPVYIAKADFPKTEILSLPNMTDFSQVLVNVAEGKADFTIVDAYTFGAYNKNNPGKLKLLFHDQPVRVYPVSYVFNPDDVLFRDAFNAALDELILDGTINNIMDQYDIYPDAFYRAVVPLQRSRS